VALICGVCCVKAHAGHFSFKYVAPHKATLSISLMPTWLVFNIKGANVRNAKPFFWDTITKAVVIAKSTLNPDGLFPVVERDPLRGGERKRISVLERSQTTNSGNSTPDHRRTPDRIARQQSSRYLKTERYILCGNMLNGNALIVQSNGHNAIGGTKGIINSQECCLSSHHLLSLNLGLRGNVLISCIHRAQLTVGYDGIGSHGDECSEGRPKCRPLKAEATALFGIVSLCFCGRNLYVYGDPAKWIGWVLFCSGIVSLCIFAYGFGGVLARRSYSIPQTFDEQEQPVQFATVHHGQCDGCFLIGAAFTTCLRSLRNFRYPGVLLISGCFSSSALSLGFGLTSPDL
jgi:hypothetical protein